MLNFFCPSMLHPVIKLAYCQDELLAKKSTKCLEGDHHTQDSIGAHFLELSGVIISMTNSTKLLTATKQKLTCSDNFEFCIKNMTPAE